MRKDHNIKVIAIISFIIALIIVITNNNTTHQYFSSALNNITTLDKLKLLSKRVLIDDTPSFLDRATITSDDDITGVVSDSKNNLYYVNINLGMIFVMPAVGETSIPVRPDLTLSGASRGHIFRVAGRRSGTADTLDPSIITGIDPLGVALGTDTLQGIAVDPDDNLLAAITDPAGTSGQIWAIAASSGLGAIRYLPSITVTRGKAYCVMGCGTDLSILSNAVQLGTSIADTVAPCKSSPITTIPDIINNCMSIDPSGNLFYIASDSIILISGDPSFPPVGPSIPGGAIFDIAGGGTTVLSSASNGILGSDASIKPVRLAAGSSGVYFTETDDKLVFVIAKTTGVAGTIPTLPATAVTFQKIYHITGTGGVAPATEDTLATSEALDPIGIAVDSAENIFISDSQHSLIRMISAVGDTTLGNTVGLPGVLDAANFSTLSLAPGKIYTVLGTGTATNSVDGPGGDLSDDIVEDVGKTGTALLATGALHLDSLSNLYFTDDNRQIRALSSATGDNIKALDPQLFTPSTVQKARVYPVAGADAFSTTLPSSKIEDNQLLAISHAFAKNGDLYILDFLPGLVMKVINSPTSQGDISVVAGNGVIAGEADGPSSGTTFDNYTPGFPASSVALRAGFMALDSKNNIFIVDSTFPDIFDGGISPPPTGPGGSVHVIVNSSPIFGASATVGNYERATGDGMFQVAGGFLDHTTGTDFPLLKLGRTNRITIDTSDNIYLSDTENHIIYVIPSVTNSIPSLAVLPGVTTVLGKAYCLVGCITDLSPTLANTADDIPATSAFIQTVTEVPISLTTDKFGNLYYMELGRLRVVAATSDITKIPTLPVSITTTIPGNVYTITGQIDGTGVNIQGFTTDGTSADLAKTLLSTSLTSDSLGQLYFSELCNSQVTIGCDTDFTSFEPRIRKIDTTKKISTVVNTSGTILSGIDGYDGTVPTTGVSTDDLTDNFIDNTLGIINPLSLVFDLITDPITNSLFFSQILSPALLSDTGVYSLAGITPSCGDGSLDTSLGEECDLGSSNSNFGTCSSACKLTVCGDNILQPVNGLGGTEQCDGNQIISKDNRIIVLQRCNTDCTLGAKEATPQSGGGIHRPAAGPGPAPTRPAAVIDIPLVRPVAKRQFNPEIISIDPVTVDGDIVITYTLSGVSGNELIPVILRDDANNQVIASVVYDGRLPTEQTISIPANYIQKHWQTFPYRTAFYDFLRGDGDQTLGYYSELWSRAISEQRHDITLSAINNKQETLDSTTTEVLLDNIPPKLSFDFDNTDNTLTITTTSKDDFIYITHDGSLPDVESLSLHSPVTIDLTDLALVTGQNNITITAIAQDPAGNLMIQKSTYQIAETPLASTHDSIAQFTKSDDLRGSTDETEAPVSLAQQLADSFQEMQDQQIIQTYLAPHSTLSRADIAQLVADAFDLHPLSQRTRIRLFKKLKTQHTPADITPDQLYLDIPITAPLHDLLQDITLLNGFMMGNLKSEEFESDHTILNNEMIKIVAGISGIMSWDHNYLNLLKWWRPYEVYFKNNHLIPSSFDMLAPATPESFSLVTLHIMKQLGTLSKYAKKLPLAPKAPSSIKPIRVFSNIPTPRFENFTYRKTTNMNNQRVKLTITVTDPYDPIVNLYCSPDKIHYLSTSMGSGETKSDTKKFTASIAYELNSTDRYCFIEVVNKPGANNIYPSPNSLFLLNTGEEIKL